MRCHLHRWPNLQPPPVCASCDSRDVSLILTYRLAGLRPLERSFILQLLRVAQREVACVASVNINLQSVDLFNLRLQKCFYARKNRGGSRELTIFSKTG